MIIEQNMSRNPVTATPDMGIVEAAALMKKEQVHRLPVLDDNGVLVGVISEKDILYTSGEGARSLFEVACFISESCVGDLMTKDPVTITVSTPVEEAARIMGDQDLSCLPVLDDQNKLIGIVSRSDMFHIMIELFGSRHWGVRISFLVKDKMGTIAEISKALYDNGMDIVSFATYQGRDPSAAILTLKVQGGRADEVVNTLTPYVSRMLDVREV